MQLKGISNTKKGKNCTMIIADRVCNGNKDKCCASGAIEVDKIGDTYESSLYKWDNPLLVVPPNIYYK